MSWSLVMEDDGGRPGNEAALSRPLLFWRSLSPPGAPGFCLISLFVSVISCEDVVK